VDKVLKIYDGSGAYYKGNGSLLYEIQGDLLSYHHVDLSNFEIDTFESVISNNGYDIDIDDVWRLYDIDGTLQSSGFIEKEPINSFGNLSIAGLSWTGILTRRIVDNKNYVAKTGKYIFEDILTTYFSDYSIDTTEVNTPSNSLTIGFSRRSAYDVLREVMKQSYGANNRPFDFYLYESVPGTIKAKAFERETTAVITTLLEGDISPKGINLQKRGDLTYNYIIVDGARGDPDHTPSDQDRWTEMTQAEIDTTYPGVWNCSSGDTIESEDLAGYQVEGDYSIFLGKYITSGEMYLELDLTDSDTFDLDDNNMVEGSGYSKVEDGTNQYLHVSVFSNLSIDMGLKISYRDGGSNKTQKTVFSIIGDEWTKFNWSISDLIGSNNWDYIRYVRFYYPKAQHNVDQFYVDKLYFYNLKRFRGIYNGSTNPRKELYNLDESLVSTTDCTTVATNLYKALSVNQYEGTLLLSVPITNLRAGDNIAIDLPHRDINIAAIPIQSIEYTPGRQILNVGRNKSLSEIISDVRMEMRKKK